MYNRTLKKMGFEDILGGNIVTCNTFSNANKGVTPVMDKLLILEFFFTLLCANTLCLNNSNLMSAA